MMKNWWDNQDADQQLRIKRMSALAVIIMVALVLYYASGQDEKREVPEDSVKNLTIGTDLLEDDITTKVNRSLDNVGEELSSQNKKIRDLEKLLAAVRSVPVPVPAAEKTQAEDPEQEEPAISEEFASLSDLDTASDRQDYPPPPTPNSVYAAPQPTLQLADDFPVADSVKPVILGGIQVTSGAPAAVSEVSKKKRTIYLPPSFMPAKLLIGLNALTSDLGSSNPEPIVFRVQAPAVLPNNLKANLKGCFVVANAHGNLSQERVQGRLVSLSCISLDGSAVIDQKVSGFIADADGKRGLSGNVVTKAGAHIMRSMIASAVGGIGSAVSVSNTTTSSSPLGTTQVIDTDKILQSAAGEGLKGGADAVQKLYLEWAKQTGPVIEVGATKDATIFIQEGVELEIMEKS